MALRGLYRILKVGGMMAHGELSPIPENEAQRLLIRANGYSRESLKPKPKWFSPFSDEVAALMHRIGFKDIAVKYLETNVKMDYEQAVEFLKDWVNESFIKKYQKQFKRYGVEFPMEHVIFCKK